jgi:hypothetical protein
MTGANMKNFFYGYGPYASGDEMARLAVTEDWSVDLHDPRNARYLRPLSIAADEAMAHTMADCIYGAVAEDHASNPSFNPDEVYERCLVAARRMLRDREYHNLFGCEDDFAPPLH